MKHSKRRELKTAYQGTAGLSVIYGSAVTWFFLLQVEKAVKISLEESIPANSYCLLERISTAVTKKITDVYDTYTIHSLTEM